MCVVLRTRKRLSPSLHDMQAEKANAAFEEALAAHAQHPCLLWASNRDAFVESLELSDAAAAAAAAAPGGDPGAQTSGPQTIETSVDDNPRLSRSSQSSRGSADSDGGGSGGAAERQPPSAGGPPRRARVIHSDPELEAAGIAPPARNSREFARPPGGGGGRRSSEGPPRGGALPASSGKPVAA